MAPQSKPPGQARGGRGQTAESLPGTEHSPHWLRPQGPLVRQWAVVEHTRPILSSGWVTGTPLLSPRAKPHKSCKVLLNYHTASLADTPRIGPLPAYISTAFCTLAGWQVPAVSPLDCGLRESRSCGLFHLQSLRLYTAAHR